MPEPHPFIAYLHNLASKEDRGALAALRRGLGQPPGTVPAMYPYVVPWLPVDARPWQEAAYYLVAALFALHPDPGGAGNLGASFRLAEAKEGGSAADERVSAVERRFTALLSVHPDDLPDYLRQAIGFLRSKEVPVDWHQLFQDIQNWGHPAHRVQREWARAYWGRAPETEQVKEKE
ncbi:MAG: type I-E CRISPR-associated protein Cse2/CasB [Chloroflexi bacterium]|nr:type I-E CRISPR-associated protein Cse2/CasB [Chloroflexota bacterium]